MLESELEMLLVFLLVLELVEEDCASMTSESVAVLWERRAAVSVLGRCMSARGFVSSTGCEQVVEPCLATAGP